jgi:D-alanyl-D-alanine carboxypeptidase (penicillin-binding protein 5/6)
MPDSRSVLYTLAGLSLACALLIVGLYAAGNPLYPEIPHIPAAAAYSFGTVAISAKAAVVYDPTAKKFLYEKDPDTPLPLASLTKLMSAEAVLAGADKDAYVTITPEDLKPDGDWGFVPGQVWPLHDLLIFGLVASSNDAMAAAATAVPGDIIAAMNLRAAELGLTRTYFNNPTGLDVDLETAGAYGSARDMAKLVASFLDLHPGLFEATANPSITIRSGDQTLSAEATALPLQQIPGLIAAKTGYTDLAGGNLVAAFDIHIGHPVIIAVLGSSRDGRFKDVQMLIEAARKAAALYPSTSL